MHFILMLLHLIGTPGLGAPTTSKQASENLGKVLSVSGNCTFDPSHKTISKDDRLSEGDRLSVMSKSKLKIWINEGKMLEIGPHSELYLKRNLQDQILLRIPHGSLFLVTTKNEEMEIRSSQIRILARNANLHFHQELDKPALIHVQKGSLKIIWPAGQAEISANKKPQTFYIDRLKENLTPVSATEPIPETMESLAKEADSISP